MHGVRERTEGRGGTGGIIFFGLELQERKVSGSHRAQRTTVDAVICVWCFESSIYFSTTCVLN